MLAGARLVDRRLPQPVHGEPDLAQVGGVRVVAVLEGLLGGVPGLGRGVLVAVIDRQAPPLVKLPEDVAPDLPGVDVVLEEGSVVVTRRPSENF